MQYLLFDNMDACTPADVERLMPLVSAQRREQAMRYKHVFGQWACLKSYEMLLTLLFPSVSLATIPEEQRPLFAYNNYGQPLLPNGPFFSISHCRDALAVAVDERPIGIDVESIRHADESLIRRTMNDTEQQLIFNSLSKDEAFIRLWTQKEAVLKMRGTGIVDDLASVLTADNYLLQTYHFPSYILSLCNLR